MACFKCFSNSRGRKVSQKVVPKKQNCPAFGSKLINAENFGDKKIKVEKTKIFNGIHQKNKNVTNLSFLTKISKGDHKKIEKYISIYLQTVPTDLKELQIAVNDKNFKALSSVAHKLKGNASYLGVEDVLSELNELEKMKHFKENTNEITNIVDKVSLIIEQSISELNNYILELNKQ